MARLKDLYFNELGKSLSKFELKNIFEVPN